MISFGHFQMRLDYLLDSGMHGRCSISNPCSFDCLSSAIVSISSGLVDKENKDTGHIKDTGGPCENLQAIVKCGTSEFLGKLQDASSAREMSERPHWPVLGFYLTFLVANKVVMTSKNNDGNHTQHNWESDAESYSINEEPTKDDMVEEAVDAEEEKKEDDE